MAKVKIYITPKKGIRDPQGQAVENALKHLGFNTTADVRVGKYITMEIDGEDKEKIDEMCNKLLANTIIEDYEFEIE